MDDGLIEKVARAIMLKMQMKDFGRALPTGDFETSVNQIDALEAASREAASAAIAAYEKAKGEERAKQLAELNAMLDNPPPPNEKLKELFRKSPLWGDPSE